MNRRTRQNPLITSRDTAPGLALKQSLSERNQPNGYAGLDVNGKLDINQLPAPIMAYLGVWNAASNTPALADGAGDAGDVYRVGTAGTRNLGSGSITFDVGDYVIYNGTQWEKSDTTDAVGSVAGLTGVITALALKSALGLDQVDNTSDAAKWAAVKTLTNTTLTDAKVNALKDTNGAALIDTQATASAVNRVKISNAATANNPAIRAVGGDANVSLALQGSGSGGVQLLDGNFAYILEGVGGVASAVNRVRVTPSATGAAPSVSATGADTNVDLNLFGKGTGRVLADGTPVAKALAITATKTGAYTAAAHEAVPVDATAGPVTVTLPTTPADRTRIVVQKVDATTNNVTIARGGTDTFTGGATTIALSGQWQSVVLQYLAGSATWFRIAGYTPPAAAGTGDTSTNTATSVTGEVAVFADTGGKLLKRATGDGYAKLTAGVLSVQAGVPTSDLVLNNLATAAVATNEGTTSTSYADLATTTDQVTVTIGASGKALVILQAILSHDTIWGISWVGFAASGANTIAASDLNAAVYQSPAASVRGNGAITVPLTGLTAGSTTFKMKYKRDAASGGTSFYSNRRITVVPL